MTDTPTPNLRRLLENRHAGDFYVPECKLGASGSRVLDGWALLPTWSPLTTIGYEVKTTRSDWVRDQKFLEYRPVCHLLVVVAPKGLVAKGELPDGVGLLEPAGERLVMRVKPARVDPDWRALSLLMAYVLMWRVKVDHDKGVARDRRLQFWREFAEQKADFRRIGRSVQGRMRILLTDAIERADAAERRANNLADAAQLLDQMGIRLDAWNIRKAIERSVRDAGGAEAIRDIDAAVAALSRVRAAIEPQEQEKVS